MWKVTYITFKSYVCFLGMEAMTFALSDELQEHVHISV